MLEYHKVEYPTNDNGQCKTLSNKTVKLGEPERAPHIRNVREIHLSLCLFDEQVSLFNNFA